MKGSVEDRTSAWLCFVGELLRDPLVEFPIDAVSDRLVSSFDVTGVSWSWRKSDGSFGLSITPESLRHQGEGWEQWEAGELFDIHPLVQWHATTWDTRPQTLARVPDTIVAAKDRQFLTGLLATFGCEQQLTIPCRCHGREHQAFVLARSGRDFPEEDLEVACLMQHTLNALHHQVQLFESLGLARAAQRDDLGLTARELLVLRLLAAGHSARGIARRLDTSPRTIQKHLEHIYRKVHVNDRMNAVRVAREAGVLLTLSSGRDRG